MRIVALLFERFTALDIIGPYEVLSRLPDAVIRFAGKETKEYRDPHGLVLRSEHSIQNIQNADVLVVPGGPGIDDILDDKEILDWLRSIHGHSHWTVSVCSGSLLLAAAGILNGRQCTTHWRRMEQLKKYPVNVRQERYVHDGKIITAAGVSAGIDMALYLVSKLADNTTARMIQLGLEYDPHPPFDCGSPAKAEAELLNMYAQLRSK
jgi:transcriptional regulator GlxA family with amidase domain